MFYIVPRWDERFENHRSRKVKDLQWVPVPNSHDGEGYGRVMAHPLAAQIFAAWILILEVASKCSHRGVLVRDNGKPHTPESLSMKTRADAEWFRVAFEVLSSEEIGWLTTSKMLPVRDDAQVRADDDTSARKGVEEENGREKKEGEEGMESADIASALTDLLLDIPACKRALEVGLDPLKAVEEVRTFVSGQPSYPPEWWRDWVTSMRDDLPIRRAKFYGEASETAVRPARVLSGEWKFRPAGPPGSGPWTPDTDWLPVEGSPGMFEHVTTGDVRTIE